MDKIYTCFSLLFLTICFGILQSCDTKKDTICPEIIVNHPTRASIYENGDTIRFQAVMSDESKLTTVGISLVDENNKPLLSTISLVPDTNPFTFEGDYIIDDPLLPGGVYQLRFQALDGENVTNHFIEIQIHELEQRLLYPVVVTHPEPGKWLVYKQKDDKVWQQVYTHSGDYSGSAVNSAGSQFYICGISQTGITSINLTDGNVDWTVKPGIHQSMRWFEAIQFTYPNLYASITEGTIRGYNKIGNEIYKSGKYSNAVPYQSVTTQNFVISSFKDAFSNDRFLVTFHNPGGLMINNKFFEGEIAGLSFVKSDKILVFSNSNGQGKISLYDGFDNMLSTLYPFFGGVITKAVVLDSDNYMLATSNGLYWYRLSNNSLTLFVAKEFEEIVYDITTQCIFACSGKALTVYSFPDAALLESYPLPDTAVALHLVFNR